MASLWEMMAAQEDAQMNHLNEMNQQYKEKQALRDAIANRPQQTTFAEPVQPQQPQTLSGIGQGMSLTADPSLTEIQGRTGQSPEQASYEALRRIDPAKAQEYATKVLANAHNIAQMGDHEGSVNYVNQNLGTNLKYLGTKDNIMTIANGDGTHTIYDISTGKDKIIGTKKPNYQTIKDEAGNPTAFVDLNGMDESGKPKVFSIADLRPGASAGAKGGMPEVMRNLDYVYREPNATDAQIRLGELADVAGVAGSKGVQDLMGTVSKQYTDKSDKTQIVEIPSPDGKTAQKYLLNTATGEKKPIGPAYAVKSQVTNVNVSNGTTGTDKQIRVWADKIAAGQVTLKDIPARGNIRTQVLADLADRYPNADLNKLAQGIKFDQAMGTMNTKALLNTINPLLDSLVEKGAELADTGSPIVNKGVRWAQKEVLPDVMGGEKVSAFDNFRDDTIAEVERGLMNSGVLSDSKYNRAIKNLNSAQTQKQRVEAVKNIKEVIRARLESLANGPNGGMAPQAPARTPSGRPLPKF